MTARLGSKYRYFGKLVLVPFRYFSIDIYRNIDIFDNTIIVQIFCQFLQVKKRTFILTGSSEELWVSVYLTMVFSNKIIKGLLLIVLSVFVLR